MTPRFAVYFDTIPAFAKRLENEPRPMSQTRLRELVEEAAQDPNIPGPFADGEITPEFLRQNGICVGDPDDVIATVKRFQDIGLDQLVMVPVVGSQTPHEKTLESIRLLGEKVLPQFRS